MNISGSQYTLLSGAGGMSGGDGSLSVYDFASSGDEDELNGSSQNHSLTNYDAVSPRTPCWSLKKIPKCQCPGSKTDRIQFLLGGAPARDASNEPMAFVLSVGSADRAERILMKFGNNNVPIDTKTCLKSKFEVIDDDPFAKDCKSALNENGVRSIHQLIATCNGLLKKATPIRKHKKAMDPCVTPKDPRKKKAPVSNGSVGARKRLHVTSDDEEVSPDKVQNQRENFSQGQSDINQLRGSSQGGENENIGDSASAHVGDDVTDSEVDPQIDDNVQPLKKEQFLGHFTVDITQIEAPPENLLIRPIDTKHVADIRNGFLENRTRSNRVFSVVWLPEDPGDVFKADDILSYNFYRLTGNHTMTALSELLAEKRLSKDADCFNLEVNVYWQLDEHESLKLARLDNLRNHFKEQTWVNDVILLRRYLYRTMDVPTNEQLPLKIPPNVVARMSDMMCMDLNSNTSNYFLLKLAKFAPVVWNPLKALLDADCRKELSYTKLATPCQKMLAYIDVPPSMIDKDKSGVVRVLEHTLSRKMSLLDACEQLCRKLKEKQFLQALQAEVPPDMKTKSTAEVLAHYAISAAEIKQFTAMDGKKEIKQDATSFLKTKITYAAVSDDQEQKFSLRLVYKGDLVSQNVIDGGNDKLKQMLINVNHAAVEFFEENHKTHKVLKKAFKAEKGEVSSRRKTKKTRGD